MIVVRKIIKNKSSANFGFPNPFARIQEVDRGAEYQRKNLQIALNKAKAKGKNLRDPTVLQEIMKPVAQKAGKHPGGSIFTRRRKTKKGKIVVEQVRR